jgi:hypothetical protein
MTGYGGNRVTEYIPLSAQNAGIENDPEAPHYEQHKLRKRTLRGRIGTIGILTLYLGSALLLPSVALLALIWKESTAAVSGGRPQVPWIQIINAGWISKLITICTALIRIIIALQASQATAMIASVILEAIGTPLLHAPFFSIIRAASTAPHVFLFPPRLLPRRSILSFCVCILAFLEVIVTIASQFLSTLLISDLADGVFIDSNNSTDIPLFRYNGEITLPWWSTSPAASYTFAEASQSFSEGPGFQDTGHTYRAFLPFETETQRTNLRRYHGPAPVTDDRVICMRPSLFNLTLDGDSVLRLAGQMSLNGSVYPTLNETNTSRYYDFNCVVPEGLYHGNATKGVSSLCSPTRLAIINSADQLMPQTASWLFYILDVLSEDANGWIIRSEKKHEVGTIRGDGPWAVVNNGSTNTESLRMTACITNTFSRTFVVDMESSWDGLEPRLLWSSDGFNTSGSRQQLRASLTPDSLNRRGVLSLSPRSQWEEYNDGVPQEGINSTFSVWPFLTSLPIPRASQLPRNSTQPNPGVLLSKENTIHIDNAHLAHVDLFQDTLIATGSPALAIQTLITRSSQMVYYELLPRHDTTARAVIASTTAALTPRRWTGFIITLVIIATHFIVVLITAVVFLKYTKSSFLGEYWQAISQVVTKDTRPILEQAVAMKDSEIEQWGQYQESRLAGQSFVRYRRNGRAILELAGRDR